MTFDGEDTFGDLDGPFTQKLPAPSLTPQDARGVLAHVLNHLTTAFVSDAGGALDTALTTIAILVSRWMCQPYPLRLVLAGSTGTGKTRLLHAVSEMTSAPSTILPVTQMAESSWSGLQLGELVRTLHPDRFTNRGISGRIIAPSGVLNRPCCLLLDEVDKLALVTPNRESLDGAARAWRIGRQQTLLACLDPLSELPLRMDDVDGVVRWSLASSIVICAGAFPMFGPAEVITPAALLGIGFTAELVDRLGVILMLPQPSTAARRQVACGAAGAMLDFARALDLEVQGVEAFVNALPAPGSDGALYVGVRGLRHHVEQRIANAIASAVARSESVARVDEGAA
jgi:hypothetical protein